MFGCSIAFIRMRSPSSAPPDLRRDGSIEMIAILSRSCWSRRKRRTSSSVSELLPAPPVPVTPSVGACRLRRGASSSSRCLAGTVPASRPVISRASARVRAACARRSRARRDPPAGLREIDVAGGDDLADHPLQPELLRRPPARRCA